MTSRMTPKDRVALAAEVDAAGPWADDDERAVYASALGMAFEWGLSVPQIRAVFRNASEAVRRNERAALVPLRGSSLLEALTHPEDRAAVQAELVSRGWDASDVANVINAVLTGRSDRPNPDTQP